MRKIAILATALSLFVTAAGTHVASAQTAHHFSNEPAQIAEVAQADPAPAAITPTPVTQSVVAGDTLSGIAEVHSTTYMRLYDANDFISDPDLIYVGDEIRIPDASEQIASRELPVPAPAAPAEATAAPADPAPVAETTPVVEAAPAPAPAPAPQPAPAPVAAAPVSDNAAKAYIYAHESSNNPNATNEIGCYGLGQDCNGQVRDLCGADYACQDEFFTRYAMNRYGSWENALAFWQSHHWW